ncbi:MAG: DUF2764 family protein [Tenuifilaceae bacterium]|jgi:hypothetical protein|nr:DUF2764 family protein [Tenuifilaceae bacterium]
MAREYYYLIAGLPDLFIDQERKDFNLVKLKDEIKESIHPDDFKLVEKLFLEYDNENFQNFLFERKSEFNPLGKYPQELYKEFTENLSEFPEYIQEFYLSFTGKNDESDEEDQENDSYYSDKVEKIPEVKFQEMFYQYIQKSNNQFLNQWYNFLQLFNNLLVAISSRKNSAEMASQMVGEGELVETFTRSQAADFGLKREIDFLEPLLQITEQTDIIERERRIDMLKWDMADEFTTFDYFNINKILAFMVKAKIVNRWAKLDSTIGAQMFEKLVTDLRQTYEMPKEFDK